MIRRISVALAGMVLAALALFATFPQNPKANPAEAARSNNLGVAYMNQQLFEKALKSFQQAGELDPRLTIARLNEGIAYLNLQKISEAKAALEAAIKQDAKIPNAWYNLGLLAKNTGDADAAVDAFKHVVKLEPSDADTWYFLGASYVQAKQFPLAIDAFQHALKINPLHASAEFGLSRAYQQSQESDQAREHLKRFQYITQKKIGAPISLAYGEQGQYSRAMESPAAILKAPAQIKVQFVDVTKEAGLVGRKVASDTNDLAGFFGPGACFLDYDNDGRPDIFLADNGSDGGIALYHNLGNGKFEEVTRKAGLDPNLHGIGCAAGDYDNDGAVDLAVSLKGRVLLLHNEKNGTFKDIAESPGIQSPGLNVGTTFVDYDHDGDLDLFVTKTTDDPCVDPRELSPPPCTEALPNFQTLWRNNGNGTFTDQTSETIGTSNAPEVAAVGTDYNNDRAIDLIVTGSFKGGPAILENPREGRFHVQVPWPSPLAVSMGVAVLDFDHDGWMDLAFTHMEAPALTLWRNNHGKSFEPVNLPETNWVRAYGVAAIDYDNDGWVDLVAVGETKGGQGEIKLFRNLGADGFKDVTADVGLDKIHLEHPRAIITGDYDNDGATDLLVTQNHGPAVLLRNVVQENPGGNRNHWLRLSLKGLADNKSAIGTKVEVFAGGNRQKFEIAGSNGYLGQNSTDIVVGLGEAKQADVVRMLWPTGVLQDEINVEGDRQQNFTEIDRRGSSCPTLFVWNGKRYEFVADMLGAGVVGHWVGPGQRDVPRPVEWIKVDRDSIHEKESHVSQKRRDMGHPTYDHPKSYQHTSYQHTSYHPTYEEPTTVLSFRFMEPLEEAVYLDQVRLLAVDHPADVEVYPNEYFASNPPYPEFKVVVSKREEARPPAGAWDEHGHDVLPDLLAHRYFGDFALTQFQGFAKPHTLTLDLGEAYQGGPLWLLMHGEVEYFSANSMYAASQAGVRAISPYVEALVANQEGSAGRWVRMVDDMGFPAGGPRTMTADLTRKLPRGTRKIRITTNLQVYWDGILMDRTEQGGDCQTAGSSTRAQNALARNDSAKAEGDQNDKQSCEGGFSPRLSEVPLVRADLEAHGYPLKIEGTPPGNVQYVYEKTSATGPYTRPAGAYTRYGDVLPLLTSLDDRLAVFGSGDEVQLDFDPSKLPALPQGWVRDYFFAAYGYEKDMDFYAAQGDFVAPMPFLKMSDYPYGKGEAFPLDDAHVNYLLEYNTRSMSGNEQRGYWFDYGGKP